MCGACPAMDMCRDVGPGPFLAGFTVDQSQEKSAGSQTPECKSHLSQGVLQHLPWEVTERILHAKATKGLNKCGRNWNPLAPRDASHGDTRCTSPPCPDPFTVSRGDSVWDTMRLIFLLPLVSFFCCGPALWGHQATPCPIWSVTSPLHKPTRTVSEGVRGEGSA